MMFRGKAVNFLDAPSLKLTAKAPENNPLEKEIPIGNHHF